MKGIGEPERLHVDGKIRTVAVGIDADNPAGDAIIGVSTCFKVRQDEVRIAQYAGATISKAANPDEAKSFMIQPCRRDADVARRRR